MPFKDVLSPMSGEEDDGGLVRVLEIVSAFSGAHVAATLVWPIVLPVFSGDPMSGEMVFAEVLTRAYEDAGATLNAVRRRFAQTEISAEPRLLIGTLATIREQIGMQARHVDLTIMHRSNSAHQGAAQDILEAALMDSGRPVFLAPQGWSPNPSFNTVLIGWNASKESARAVAESLPLLAAAKRIVVATVDARPAEKGFGELPGIDIATHLARHGLSVDLHNLAGASDNPGDALISAARDTDADLIVTGGFGHARVQQALFGGVTRTLVDHCPTPLFLSH